MTGDEEHVGFLAHLLAVSSPTSEGEAQDVDRMAAALSQALDEATTAEPSMIATETLAALVDNGLTAQEASALLRAPADRARAEASVAFVEDVRRGGATALDNRVSDRLVSAARSRLNDSVGEIIAFQRRPHAPPAPESFRLLAASSGPPDQAIVCRSESGLWTLRTFPGISAADRAAGRCSLLVTVNQEQAAVYEGLMLRAFVMIGGQERVIIEDVVKDGAVFAEISATGLDLRNRDPISVVFNSVRSAE